MATLGRLSALLVTLCVSLAAFASDYLIEGQAYDQEDLDRLLYRERYTGINEEGERRVNYYDPDGERIAEKTLYYEEDPAKPGFRIVDKRDGSELGALWEEGGERLVLLRSGRNNLREKPVRPDSPLVIDAGFDDYVQANWSVLEEGQTLRFYFAFPNRLSTVMLRAEQILPEDSPLYQPDEPWRYFEIQVANRLMAMFADNIYLAYDQETRRLMVYQGRSNIASDDGGTWDVRIFYTYSEGAD
ncbi:hypothetical protein [Marinimicrobium alkaliphilum]|uniref:hypothetical protein n=1 Tax=Marinimicrobium alkaliphilum TaxID=2202654 RepID=UPI0013009853|nr:hypothetical protein [Marinimicrobium alkaliphilum]